MIEIKKVISKQKRFELKMEAQGFVRRKYLVHIDDHEKVKAYAHKLTEKRRKALEQQ